MSEVRVRIVFREHPCTNHTESDFQLANEDCEVCGGCMCGEYATCCGGIQRGQYCSDCGAEMEQPYCYPCNGEIHEGCSRGIIIPESQDVLYTGTVYAHWKHGELIRYEGFGHPHLDGTYCLGEAAELFSGVFSVEKAIEAIVTHLSNVDFSDGLGGTYNGITLRRAA